MSRRTTSMSEANRYDEINKNIEFFNGRGWWVFYALVLVGANTCIVGALKIIYPELARYGFTITSLFHTLITLYILHWTKGAPFWAPELQGRYDHLTFWEQIDYGAQHTSTKKILTAIPVFLCIASCVEAKWTSMSMIINIVLCLISVVGKLPMMHRVRVLGINED